MGLGLLVLAGLVVLVLARDVATVASSLQSAERSLVDAEESLAAGDVDATSAHLQDARDQLDTATGRVNRLLWRVAQKVPVAGRSLRNAEAIVSVADETARLGRGVVEGARELIGPDGGPAIRTRDGRIPLAPLRSAADALEGMHTDVLRASLDRLQALPATLVPDRVARARTRTLTLGQRVADTFDATQDLTAALPALLGDDGARRYLLAMQNPAELRGTGGLLGFYATVEVAGGKLELSRPQSYDALEEQASDQEAEASGAFLERYGGADATRFFGSVNLDPDLPTTAPVMASLYEVSTGQSVDGVIAIDPIGLATLLRATGPVDLPADVAALAPSLPDPVPVGRVSSVTMYEMYEVFAGRNQQRRDYLRELATTAFDTIFDARWDGVAMARRVGTAASTGHLAVHVTDEDVQAALVDLDVAGALSPPEEDRDHVAVVANNSAGNKLDYHMAHMLSGSVTLSGDPELDTLARVFDLRVEVVNRFDPAGHSDYVAGSFPPGAFRAGRDQAQRGERGLSRTWFSTWVPGSEDMALDGQAVAATRFNGHSVVDRTIEIPSAQANGFDVRASGPAPVTAVGSGRRYTLELRRQPKAIPDRVDLTVVPPEGWAVVTVHVSEGGDGAGGAGPHADPGPAVSGSVTDDGRGRITGDVSADLVVRVDLGRA